MSLEPKACRVLVATNRGADAADLQQVLAEEFDCVEISMHADLAAADFERARPDVAVLAFDSLDKAQHYCIELLRLSTFAQTHAHRYVILCANDDVQAAFGLCMKEYFDDYVPYWPQPHDGYRLVMAVRSAWQRLLAAREEGLSRADSVAQAKSAEALEAIVDRRIDQSMRHVAAVKAFLARAEQAAAGTPAYEGIARALAASRESLAPVEEWAQGFRADVAPHSARGRALAAKPLSPRPLVLVVDDDPFAAKLISKALDQQGYQLGFAEAAPAALAFLRRRQPALILMDVNLPGMDGLALTELLKANPILAHIPVLMLTGEATRETIARSKAAGAAGFIVKPFAREALIAKMALMLA